MAKDTTWSDTARNAAVDARTALLNDGYLRLYTAPKPANPDTAITSQTMLSELRFGSTAFGAAVDGVATANAITPDPDAADTGTATWFRSFESDGTSPVHDGTVGTSNANAIFATTSIVQHATVALNSMTITDAEASAA